MHILARISSIKSYFRNHSRQFNTASQQLPLKRPLLTILKIKKEEPQLCTLPLRGSTQLGSSLTHNHPNGNPLEIDFVTRFKAS